MSLFVCYLAVIYKKWHVLNQYYNTTKSMKQFGIKATWDLVGLGVALFSLKRVTVPRAEEVLKNFTLTIKRHLIKRNG